MTGDLRFQIFAILTTIAMIAVGAILALNFKGFTEWSARSNIEILDDLNPIRSRRDRSRRIASQIFIARFIGSVMAIMGIVAFAGILIDIASGK